ncbi:MAG: DUF460 domain-containing protein [Sulfolobaceae archaeon]
MRVIGVDLETGSSPSSIKQAKYSVVILNDKNEIEYKSEEVTLARLIRLIWEFRPTILALDNIYELGSDERVLRRIISLLPSDLSIIQVTYVNGEFKDIKELAKNFFNDIQGKLSPSKTAYLCAFLALRGIGTKIKAVETKTKIIVSRGRSLGPGGMSQNRYKRHLRGLVLRVTKRIKEQLDSHGFDYDLIVKRSKSGIERAVFIVYSPRESLYGIIKKMKGHDVVVDIKPVLKTKIKFESDIKSRKKPLIVGIDPGIEVGISALDLYGNIVLMTSKRGIDRDDIVNIISNYGYPVIIATDVQEVPDAVKKIASITGSRIYYQSKPLTVDEKQRIVFDFIKDSGLKVENTHIRDSLVAAITAYRELEEKFRQAQSIISRLELDVDEEEILECIAKENSVSSCIEKEIEKSISYDSKTFDSELSKKNILSNVNKIIEDPEKQRELIELKRELERYKLLTKKLIREKEEVERRLDELKRSINIDIQKDRKVYELELQLKDKSKIIKNLQLQIDFYKSEIDKLKDIIENLSRGNYLIIRDGESKGRLRFENGELYIMDERVNKEIAKYIGSNFIIIDNKIIEDVEILRQERNIFESSKLDLYKIINEYRASRLKTR